MRKIIFFAAFVLPTLYALSLSDFQSLSFSDIPSSCQNAYNSQIPYCGLKDFTKSCSAHCITGLYSIAGTVSGACQGVSTNPNTLLGLVLCGTIMKVLCPSSELNSNSAFSLETPVIPPADSNGAANTINNNKPTPHPTTLSLAIGPPPILATESKLSRSASYLSTFSMPTSFPFDLSSFNPSEVTFTTTEPNGPVGSESYTTPFPPPSVIPTTTGRENTKTKTPISSLSSLTRTSSPTPSHNNPDGNSGPSNDGSGGGSPFDVQSCASNAGRSSLYAMVGALFWTGVLQR